MRKPPHTVNKQKILSCQDFFLWSGKNEEGFANDFFLKTDRILV